jgi:hypothetical protein
MRHSSITLTMDRYSHAGLYDVSGAVEKLPPLPAHPPTPAAAAMWATGTGGGPINDPLAHHLPTAGDGQGRDVAAADAMEGSPTDAPPGRIPLAMKGFGGPGRLVAGRRREMAGAALFGLRNRRLVLQLYL